MEATRRAIEAVARDSYGRLLAFVAARTPFGRQATAWEIAYAVLFFLSDESVYITAQTLAVDAGLSGL